MASIQFRKGKFQLRIKNKVLPKPLFFTFDTKPEAETFKEQVEMLLSRGVVPQVLMDQARVKVERAKAAVDSQLLTAVIQGYVNNAPVAPSEADLLAAMQGELRGVTIADVDYEWAESYVRKLKVDRGDVR
ncbi:hypothetical protein [Verminephrobacter eiseniae]|uniref:hypothetical protein n=1 Tax=Verminephrobacter eiseniae TaxID=364317 RepID=UPI0022375C17|nr:hypothetical protein [Verminephrobacter eiseniae]